jgi:hypothetical protein
MQLQIFSSDQPFPHLIVQTFAGRVTRLPFGWQAFVSHRPLKDFFGRSPVLVVPVIGAAVLKRIKRFELYTMGFDIL